MAIMRTTIWSRLYAIYFLFISYSLLSVHSADVATATSFETASSLVAVTDVRTATTITAVTDVSAASVNNVANYATSFATSISLTPATELNEPLIFGGLNKPSELNELNKFSVESVRSVPGLGVTKPDVPAENYVAPLASESVSKNVPSVSGLQNIPSVSRLQNIPRVSSMQNVPSIQNVPSVQNVPSMQNVPSALHESSVPLSYVTTFVSNSDRSDSSGSEYTGETDRTETDRTEREKRERESEETEKENVERGNKAGERIAGERENYWRIESNDRIKSFDREENSEYYERKEAINEDRIGNNVNNANEKSSSDRNNLRCIINQKRFVGNDRINRRTLSETIGTEYSSENVLPSSGTQQSVLCDLAGSLPAVLTYSTNAWNCSAVVSSSSLCSFRGIVCDVTGTITGITVSSGVGTTSKSVIPASMSTLTGLKSLSIKSSSLRGTIPSSLSSLLQLKSLILSTNLLSGTIPSTLSALTSLQTLYLDNNSLYGTIPANLILLNNIIYLDLALNKLYGKFPTFSGMASYSAAHTTPISAIDSPYSYQKYVPQNENGKNVLWDDVPWRYRVERDKSTVERVVQTVYRLEDEEEEWGDNSTNVNDENGDIESDESFLTDEEEEDDSRELKSLQSYYSPHTYYSPTPLTSVTGLRFLSLYANFFTGNVPASIGGITTLRELHLSYNSFTGTLPSTLGLLTSLQSLSLQWNSFLGSIPSSLGALSKLSILKLFTNSMTGTLPPSLGSLTALQILYLRYNILTGKIPSSFGNMQSIQQMDLSFNFLSGSIPSTLYRLNATIVNLYLKQNVLTGTIPSNLGGLKSITRLGLNQNSLIGTIPSSLSKLTKLSLLYLSVNSLHGTIPTVLGLLTGLLQISLRGNMLTSTIPSSIGSLKSLSYLQLYANSLTGTLPSSLSKLLKLNSFFLQSNSFIGTIPSSYGVMVALTNINMGYNSLNGSIPSTFSKLKLLNTLVLNNNKLIGNISTLPLLLAQLPLFSILDLSVNKFTGKLFPNIGKIKLISSLNFAYNMIKGTIPSQINLSPLLLSFNISGNSMTGMIPRSVLNYSALTAFDVRNNSLHGPFSSTLCSLSSLSLIYISGNNFSCYAPCLAPPSDISSTATSLSSIVHCQGLQDDVICAMAAASNIHYSIQRSGTYTPITVQNNFHPYLALTTEYATVAAPGAVEYTISFDILTMTELFQDIVIFCATPSCLVVYGSTSGYSGLSGSSFPGLGGTPKLIISASTFVVRFTSNGKNQFWGYRLTALAGSAPGAGWLCDSKGYATGEGKTVCGVTSSVSPASADIYCILSLSNTFIYERLLDSRAGVTCAGPQVRKIDLSSLGIIGTLPSTIGSLTNLLELDMHFNFLGKKLPTTIGKLVALQYLDLSGNAFSGTIPISFGLLTNAWKVSLSSNVLTGHIPTALANLQSVKYFLMASNKFSGKFPKELCNISLANIDISGNNEMTCYESMCWYADTNYYNFGTLPYCAPTSQPTSVPSQPSSRPSSRPSRGVVLLTTTTASAINLTAVIIAAVVGSLSLCCCCVCIFAFLIRRRRTRESRIKKKLRLQKLSFLPIHRAIIEKVDADVILRYLSSSIVQSESAKDRDFDGRTAFDIAVDNDMDMRVVSALLINSLPFDCESAEPLSPSRHGFAWAKVVELDKYEPAVCAVLSRYPAFVHALARSDDQHGRHVIDIASPKCKKAILQMIYIFRRYEITTPLKQPLHQSSSCVVHLAVDRDDSDRAVALKFMRSRDQFVRETRVRASGMFSEEFVLNIIRSHDGDEDDSYRDEVEKKGLRMFNYCLVMDAGDVNLCEILNREHAGNNKDWETIRQQVVQIARAVEHVHAAGYIHGDLKPLNIVRFGQKLKLIDFDASVSYANNEEHSGIKYSSAYLPPEMLYVTADNVCVRSPCYKSSPGGRSRDENNTDSGSGSDSTSIKRGRGGGGGGSGSDKGSDRGGGSGTGNGGGSGTGSGGGSGTGSVTGSVNGEKWEIRGRNGEVNSGSIAGMVERGERGERGGMGEGVGGRGSGGRGSGVSEIDEIPPFEATPTIYSSGSECSDYRINNNNSSNSIISHQFSTVGSQNTVRNSKLDVILKKGRHRSDREYGEMKRTFRIQNKKRREFVHFQSDMEEKRVLGEDDFDIVLLTLALGEDDFDLVLARPAHDLWALGALLFFMAVNAPLFYSDAEGNVLGDSELRVIAAWTDEVKLSKMLCVKNIQLRNLISQLLVRDPLKRPDISHVLSHPFVTGKHATRLAGEVPEFDVFLSYRVDSDLGLVNTLYKLLVAEGITVWLDRVCLSPGEPWEDGFSRGMAMSKIFVPVLSRGGIKSGIKARNNFELLTGESPCDNVLLEHRLALELKERGLIEKIFPLFLGDPNLFVPGEYLQYDFNGPDPCYPKCPLVVVSSVEMRTREHLDKQGMGLPLLDAMSVDTIVTGIARYQGSFIKGDLNESLNVIVSSIIAMVDCDVEHISPEDADTLGEDTNDKEVDKEGDREGDKDGDREEGKDGDREGDREENREGDKERDREEENKEGDKERDREEDKEDDQERNKDHNLIGVETVTIGE